MVVPVFTPILRTDNLTGITTVQTVANFQHKLFIHEAFRLGHKRNAALCIQLSRSHQCSCWTGINTLRTFTTILGHRVIWLKRNIRDQFAEKDP
ncbi:hypothetical protein gpAD87_31875 [Paenibacillus sp. AD87]|nr:hypothetical protein gpAD87_31875 [Paenibacillus sp. AD87]